ncbi:MAG TPA: FAD-dependent thymidylate synthase [Gemmatimonadaceae bacterium]|nr:FAD-dependent thymidylate synthase [Gemmatimonadaceae bacterium]
MYEARIERDSITQYGERVTTWVVTLPRIVLAELNTHKMISKSSASSRAIPVQKQIDRLNADPFLPVYWGKNQKGMQADQELSSDEMAVASEVWIRAMRGSITAAEELMGIGVHKQIASRILEAWMWHTVILTATDMSNFFHLRDNKKAQPEIAKAAGMMSELFRGNRPKLLGADDWHLPFVETDGEDQELPKHESTGTRIETAVHVGVGRCARVSHLNHDGQRAIEGDVRLSARLYGDGHMAPYEHVCRPMTDFERRIFGRDEWVANPECKTFTAVPMTLESRWIPTGKKTYYLGNFNGWVQARKLIHGESDILAFER